MVSKETKVSDTTTWSCSVQNGAASLTFQVNSGNPQPFSIKGMCYSPCPIGDSNQFGNLGDWFWDTFTVGGTTITSWQGTWSNDLPNIIALGANTIRVYCMLDEQMEPGTQTFTHQNFLDTCYENGIFVLVGIPLPSRLFCESVGPPPSPYDTTWWTARLTNTVLQLADHPAVMGFIIANEVDDGATDTYNPSNAQYWWSQIEAMAKIAKTNAPNKLVGIANHDDPGICEHCQTYMANCPSVDFWGVNTYQPQTFASVFGGNGVTGYSTLTGNALKPVILTEYGFPSTGRLTADTLNPQNIIWSPSQEWTDGLQSNVATVLTAVMPTAYTQYPINLGICYFEYCDELWNQSAYQINSGTCPGANSPYAPNAPTTQLFSAGPLTSYFGGPPACGFPNYYWDNDGFGLYAVEVGTGRNPSQPWDGSTNAPALPLDQRLARNTVITALQSIWGTTAQGMAVMEAGVVLEVVVTNPGAGYDSPPSVMIQPPGNDGTVAQAVATIGNGIVTAVVMTDQGSGYDFGPQVTFSPPSTN